jgi:hypothetical protein
MIFFFGRNKKDAFIEMLELIIDNSYDFENDLYFAWHIYKNHDTERIDRTIEELKEKYNTLHFKVSNKIKIMKNDGKVYKGKKSIMDMTEEELLNLKP